MFAGFENKARLPEVPLPENVRKNKSRSHIFVQFFWRLSNSHFFFLLIDFLFFFRYIRLLVFTLEVAIGSMSKNVDQFILLLDASKLSLLPPFLVLESSVFSTRSFQLSLSDDSSHQMSSMINGGESVSSWVHVFRSSAH